MSAFTLHRGICAPIREDNVDTDQIIPSREMKRVSKKGLGDGLFAGWRYRYDGKERTGTNDDFVLNQAAYANTTILLGGQNFGCGSSREHAVWALADFGIRVILAESFGRIFRNNCARNRLLAVTLTGDELDTIENATSAEPQQNLLQVDLRNKKLTLPTSDVIAFDLPEFDRTMLLKGLDYIDFTLQYADDIDRFVESDRRARGWAYL